MDARRKRRGRELRWVRQIPELPSHEASKVDSPAVLAGACGQVVGVTSESANADAYRPSLPSPERTSADDGGRSRLPLRGSPRFPLGSLLSPARTLDANTSLTMSSDVPCVNRYRRERQVRMR